MSDQRDQLSRRERQIMDVVYAHGEASVNAVLGEIPEPPGRTAVRTMLRILEEKGHLRHRKEGREFIYRPTRPRRRAGLSALHKVLETFYNGSVEEALAAHLFESKVKLSEEQLRRLGEVIQEAKHQGR